MNILGDAVALDQDGELMRIVEGGALPTTLFIDERGDIAATHLGEISRAALLDQIASSKRNDAITGSAGKIWQVTGGSDQTAGPHAARNTRFRTY